MAPNIPEAKRRGLLVDVSRLTHEGDGWLTPEDRYALKTHGVCSQQQPGVFMVRLRVTGGVLPTQQARGLARLARRYAHDWLHLTTRQNIELHWVDARSVESVLQELDHLGLSTRSSCGHTLRNVMCSEDAGAGLDEPFDCFPDASAVSAAIVARSQQLNCVLPSRVNITFGGSPRCRHDALINDAGFVSTLRAGECGYELWAGGSLGRAPQLAVRLSTFVPRRDVVAAAEALVEVFVAHGDIDNPSKGRMKFAIEALGTERFIEAWCTAYASARTQPHAPPADVDVHEERDRREVLSVMPPGGWSSGVRPQREPGLCSVTAGVPLGDTNGAELELLAALAERYGDGHLTLTRDQDVALRNVAVRHVSAVRAALDERGLGLLAERPGSTIRACAGSTVCSIGITDAPRTGAALQDLVSLARNSSLRVHVSGCPSSCAQHQTGDIGLAGTKVRVRGATRTGYQVFLGADLDRHEVGEVIGRLADDDLPAAIEAIVGVWESLRRPGETIGRTARRAGLDAFATYVGAVLDERWREDSEHAAALRQAR